MFAVRIELSEHARTKLQSSQSTLRPILRTIYHLHRASPDSPQHHPFPHLAQSWTRLNLASVHTLRVFRSTPQNLRSSTCSRPYHTVQDDRIGLLTPHVYLTTQNEVSQIWCDVVQRVIGVYEAPIVRWGAVIRERVVFLERIGVEIEPLSFAAVEVLINLFSNKRLARLHRHR